MGTNTGQVMTLANSIIGVSILAMPYCFKQCGIVLSVLLLCLSSILSRFACHFLLKAAIITRRRNYEFLAFHVFGSTGKLGVELAIIGFLLGTCIAFFVVMGDLGPAIISSMLGLHRTDTLRTSILVGMALFVVLPLGLLRNVDSLSTLCTASFVFYICLVLKVMGEAAGPLVSGEWFDQVSFWRPEGIWQCSPIFSMALFCQTQLFEIFDTVPNVALDRLNSVVRVAINLCTAVYISVGFFGYVAFSKENITGNILVSLSQTMSSEVIKVGFVLSVAVSFPLVIFPCRASLYSLLYRSAQPPVHDIVTSHVPEGRFKALTIGIVGISLVLGLLLPNIEQVLGIIGSTIGVTICIITPSLLLGNTARHPRDRLVSQVIMWLGAIIMILGTYTHILNTGQAGEVDSAIREGDSFILDRGVHQLNGQPIFQQHSDNHNMKKLIETSEEKPKMQHSESPADKPKISKQSYDDQSSRPKKSEVTVEEIVSKSRGDSKVKDKLGKADEKIKEHVIPVDTAEKQQEPPVPVEVVLKQASAQPIIDDVHAPVPNSESAVKEAKPENDKMKIQEKPVVQKTKAAPISNAEEVNQDAIRHEDAESALEARDLKEKGSVVEKHALKQNELVDENKIAEEQKLIKTLKKHQEVQRDILNEQQKILQELKKHEHVQKTNSEVINDPESGNPQNQEDRNRGNDPNFVIKENHGQMPVLEKEFVRKEMLVQKKTNISLAIRDQASVVPKGNVAAPNAHGLKVGKIGSGLVVPLPLAYSAKLSSSPPPAKISPGQSASKPAARDILESGAHHSDREKREVPDGSIEEEQGTGNGPTSEGKLKLEEDEQNFVKDEVEKQCHQKEKDSSAAQLGKQMSKTDPFPLNKNAMDSSMPDGHGEELLNVQLKGDNTFSRETLNLALKSNSDKDGRSSVLELKTPSSISAPEVEVHDNLYKDAKKISEVIHSSTNLKSVQSKETQ